MFIVMSNITNIIKINTPYNTGKKTDRTTDIWRKLKINGTQNDPLWFSARAALSGGKIQYTFYTEDPVV